MAMVMPRARSSGALSIESKLRNCASPRSASTLVIAAVSVVLPWSTCPIVPTFTCGLVRSNLPFAMMDMLLLLLVPVVLARDLADDRLGDGFRCFGVILEFHGVRRAALRERAHRRRVAEHLRERHLGADD